MSARQVVANFFPAQDPLASPDAPELCAVKMARCDHRLTAAGFGGSQGGMGSAKGVSRRILGLEL